MVQANYQKDNQTQSSQLEAEQEAKDFSSQFEIHQELDYLAEIIAESSRIPFTELGVLDTDLAIEQLNFIRLNLPVELDAAREIINRQQEIVSEAEAYACLILKSAEEKKRKIVQESAIVKEAELEGAKIRLKIEQECEQLKKSTIAEVEAMRQQAIAECMAMQNEADNYADGALGDIEQRLKEMLAIVQNGRQQIAQTSSESTL